MGKKVGIISSYPPEKDGIAPAAKYHADALRENTDHKPVIISSSEKADYRIKRDSLMMWREINNAVEDLDIDILHAHHTLTLYSFGGISLALIDRDISLIVSFHEPRHEWTKSLNPKRQIAHRVEDLIYRRADHRIIHTEKDRKKFAKRYGGENISQIPLGNPVRNAEFPDSIDQLLVFGFIHPNKDFRSVMKSADYHDKKIVIAGSESKDYGMTPELKELAEGRENIELKLGYIPEDEKDALFQQSDAVIIPYLYGTEEATREASDSGVLREAMSYNRPVITSKTAIFQETFERYEVGKMTELSPRSIADSIGDLEENLETVRGEIERFNDENSWSKIIESYSEIYTDLE
ncbi:glycosyltransferase [Nanohaloarchaea archaeon H01]|nr:glycosyltransferase [Nanohaloarchaea archaeon H01]